MGFPKHNELPSEGLHLCACPIFSAASHEPRSTGFGELILEFLEICVALMQVRFRQFAIETHSTLIRDQRFPHRDGALVFSERFRLASLPAMGDR